MKTADRPCPICEHHEVELLHKQNFALPNAHPLANGYEVVTCSFCGFVYADTDVSQAAYDLFYAEYSKYEDKQTGTGGIDKEWDWDRLKQTARAIAEHLADPETSVLDVGCANGGLLKALMDLGYRRLLGIDPSPVCVDNTRKLGINAEVGSLFQPLEHEPVGCVVLSHTLEHIQNLKNATHWISTASTKGATVYIEVPDASRYKDFVDAPFQDFNTEHINHFSLKSLENYLRLNGFSPIKYGTKVIPASANKSYPAIFCFAQKNSTITSIEKDQVLRQDIEAYIVRSQIILDEIEKRLRATLAKHSRIIVWGTGQLTMKLLAQTSLAKADIIAFVDSNPINQGKVINGISVLSPDKLREYSDPILISSTLHQQSITNQIDKMGLNNPLILLRDE